MDKLNRTLLINAVIDKKIDEVEKCLLGGVDINAQDKLGKSALHYAAQNFSLEIAASLLRRECKVDLQDMHGNSPLSEAVFNSAGRGDMISILIQFGADKNLKNKHRVSPLELAETITNYQIKKFLLD